MKAINFKLATFSFAALLLASCSDSNNDIIDNGGGTTSPSIVGKTVTSITDAQTLAARVNNFKATLSTRVAGATSSDLGDVYTMEEEPSVPQDAQKLSELTTNQLEAGKSYIVENGESIDKKFGLNGTIYVKGTLNLNTEWTLGSWTVVVCKGGTLKFNGSKLFPNGGKILCYGDFNCDNNLYIYGGTVKVAGNWDLGTHELQTNNSNIYVGGKLTCGNLKNENHAFTNIQGGTSGLEDKDIKIDGIVNINGNAKFKSLTFDNAGQLYCCSLTLTDDLVSSGGDGAGSGLHTSYLKVNNLTLNSANSIYLVNNGVIECSGTLTNNSNNKAFINLQGDDAKALIKANEIKWNGSGSSGSLNDNYTFRATGSGSNFYIACDSYYNGSQDGKKYAYGDVNFAGANAHNFKDPETGMKIVASECGYTITPAKKEEKKKIDEIGEIIYDSHDHDISATCIQPYNGKMYMSYHTRGNGHGACIEVFETGADKQTRLLQYLQDTNQELDFNHLMVDAQGTTPYLYVVGNFAETNDKGNQSKAGAMLARIDINSNGLLNTEVKNLGEAAINPLTVVELTPKESNNEDENAIVRDGNKLLITSTRGYEAYDANSLELLNSKETPGKAKHIALSNGEIATLYYNERPSSVNDAVTGTLELFNRGTDITTAQPNKSISVDNIAPNNGKNTIAIDGDNIYVCRSAEGLTCYDKNSGAEKWTWQAPLTATTKVPQGYANGVTYDNKYIYLACGGYGLVVLDKNNFVDGKPAVYAKKRSKGVINDKGNVVWNSANYVTLNNGYIYVAYGKSRLQIYQLLGN